MEKKDIEKNNLEKKKMEKKQIENGETENRENIVISAKKLKKVFKVPKKEENPNWWSKVRNIFYRRWCEKVALKEVSFTIKRGEFVGYLGPNGAGKSTTLKILTGIISPTAGKIKVLDFDPHQQRYDYSYNIGVVFGQRRLLQYDIPVIDSLNLYRDIYELDPQEYKERLAYFTKMLKLDRYLHIPVRKLSLGERMRCEIAAALLHRPKIVFLDEPTIGLDAIAKEEIRNFLKMINEKEKVTIILTTHDMDDIEELCERIIIIDEGLVVYDGGMEQLKKEIMHHKTIEVEFSKVIDGYKLHHLLKNSGIEALVKKKHFLRLKVDLHQVVIPEVVKNLFSSVEVIDLIVHEPRLEQVIKEIYERKK